MPESAYIPVSHFSFKAYDESFKSGNTEIPRIRHLTEHFEIKPAVVRSVGRHLSHKIRELDPSADLFVVRYICKPHSFKVFTYISRFCVNNKFFRKYKTAAAFFYCIQRRFGNRQRFFCRKVFEFRYPCISGH